MRRWLPLVVCMAWLVAAPASGAAGDIATVAGNGVSGSGGDGGPATQASLLGPAALDIGPDGSLYIADTFNHRIRKVAPNGVITRVAGGSSGYSGDGGPATLARFNQPSGIAVSSTGEIFVADTGNDRVRRIATNGTVETIAGGAAFTSSCFRSGIPATSSCLFEPRGLDLLGDGSVLVADTANDRIVKINPDGTVTNIAGNPNVSGYWGDGGPARSSWLALPQAVAVDGDGILIADTNNHRVRRIDAAGIITTVAGNGTGYADEHPDAFLAAGPFVGGNDEGRSATDAMVAGPAGITTLGGSMFISSLNHQRVLRVDADGILRTVAGKGTCGVGSLPFVAQPNALVGDGGPATQACLVNPRGLAIDSSGRLLIADDGNSRIRAVFLD